VRTEKKKNAEAVAEETKSIAKMIEEENSAGAKEYAYPPISHPKILARLPSWTAGRR
jgi:hypothetical protein